MKNLSKFLSLILRHKGREMGLEFSPDGYCQLSHLLSLPQLHRTTLQEIIQIVETNDKMRFALKSIDGVMWIKANQGHSMEIESLDLEPLIDTQETIIHGTFIQNWQSIQQEGLSRMNRNHIHFASGLPNDSTVKSGIRKSCNVFIYIATEKAMQDGILFFKSPNGVILSKGINGVIDKKYFGKVIDRNGRALQ